MSKIRPFPKNKIIINGGSGLTRTFIDCLVSMHYRAKWLHVKEHQALKVLSHFFLPDPGVSGVRSMGPLPVSLCHYKSFGRDFADVTLADHDTNSILADNAKREIQSNEAMQVM